MNNLAELTRKDFPIFKAKGLNDKPLIYLDHAATSQKPEEVINALRNYYSSYNANVHRGAHQLSVLATEAFEKAREVAANFISADSSKEIVFTRNASEAINLVARSWGESEIKEGDEIILSIMEHHSNIVPWQLLSQRKGCLLRFIGLTESGELDMEDLKEKISEKTKLISLVHISNALGCCNPIQEVVKLAKKISALVLVDACQSLAHRDVNVHALGVDFLVGSSHKICGPTGIGFLWGKEHLLERMPPFLGGGEMIQEVDLFRSSWADLPHKFEAGTPAIGEAIAMGYAMNYLNSIGFDNIKEWEEKLVKHLFEGLSTIKGIQVLGPTPKLQRERAALAAFNIQGIHANDIAALLDESNICIRSGHHCCQPLHKYYNLSSTARASLSFTSTIEEINIFLEELNKTIFFFNEHC